MINIKKIYTKKDINMVSKSLLILIPFFILVIILILWVINVDKNQRIEREQKLESYHSHCVKLYGEGNYFYKDGRNGAKCANKDGNIKPLFNFKQ